MKKILLLASLLVSFNILLAQTQQKDYEPYEHYNHKIARSAIDEGDYDKAYEYFKKELQQYPTNGHAYYWIASILAYHQYDVDAAKNAIDYAITYLPKKDKAFLSSSYRLKGDLLGSEDNTKSAYKALEQAIKISPKDYRNYMSRADLLYKNKYYNMAGLDYITANKLNPYDELTYLGMARCSYVLGKIDDAIELLNIGIRVNSKYSGFYAARAVIYGADKKDYDKAVEDVVMALKIDGNSSAFNMLSLLAQENYSRLVAQLTLEQNADKTNMAWPYYIGIVHGEAKEYSKALGAFYKVHELHPDYALAPLADTWQSIGDYPTALKYINEAIEIDSSVNNLFRRVSIEDALGMDNEMLKDIDDIISQYPKSSSAYSKRAWLKMYSHDYQGAVEDYDMAIVLEETWPSYYVHRGIANSKRGKLDLARQDFEKAIALDTIESVNNSTEYAYYYLGRIEDAKKKMDSIMKDNDEHYYDAACLYSLMNEQDKALDYFKQALENGFRDFYHIKRDHDLDNIRNLPAFQELVYEYKAKMNKEIEQLRKQYNITIEEEGGMIEKTQEIGFTRRGGVCEVPCTINDLPLYFIFDTGASDVTISQVEANFMLKNKYLNAADIMGRRSYMTANGDISEGTVINLRSVKFGDAVLTNVKASVVKSQNAPLLLGQTVLERLGKIEIDNAKKVLRVTYKEKK